MTIRKRATSSTPARRRVLAAAGATACALSAGLMTAAPASAESRGFVVTNNSNVTLRLESVRHVDGDNYFLCPLGNYPFDFEGRRTAAPRSPRRPARASS